MNIKFTRKVKIIMKNIIYQNKKSNIYDKRLMHKL